MKFYEDPQGDPEGESLYETDSDTEACTTDDSLSEDDSSMSSDEDDEDMEGYSKGGIILHLHPLSEAKEDEEDNESTDDERSPTTWNIFNHVRRNRLSTLMQLPSLQNQQETNPNIDLPPISDYIRGNPRRNFAVTPSLHQRQLDAQQRTAYILENRDTNFTTASSLYNSQMEAAARGDSIMTVEQLMVPWTG